MKNPLLYQIIDCYNEGKSYQETSQALFCNESYIKSVFTMLNHYTEKRKSNYKKDKIVEMLKQGKTYDEIQSKISVKRSWISFLNNEIKRGKL